MLKETTQKGTCARCGRPYIAALQVDDAAVTPMVTVNCPHKAECNATFQLGIPNGADEKTLRLYTLLEWAELRKTGIPKPLTGAEFAQLELQNDVTGVSTVDVRRLLADHRRLRDLVIDAEPHVPDNGATQALMVGEAPKPMTEDGLMLLERLFREDATDPESANDAAQLTLQLVAEVRRLRKGTWLDQAALEIASDPYCCDISSSSPTAMVKILRQQLKAEVDRG